MWIVIWAMLVCQRFVVCVNGFGTTTDRECTLSIEEHKHKIFNDELEARAQLSALAAEGIKAKVYRLVEEKR